VFVHEQPCARYPECAGFPDDLQVHALTLEAYARGRRLLAQEYVTDGNAERAVERLFVRPETDYIQVCNTEAGCFAFRIARAV
jgi:hypothetical protein